RVREERRQDPGLQETCVANHSQDGPSFDLQLRLREFFRKWSSNLCREFENERSGQQRSAGKVICKQRMIGRNECHARSATVLGINTDRSHQLKHVFSEMTHLQFFSVQPVCPLCLCGCCIAHSSNHGDTE